MSIKETKRKGFNFFRSYFDVFNELPEEDKLPFITALLNKQFLGADPTDLKGMAKFAWISQQHSISEQVKGYEDKTGVKLPLSPPPPQGVKSTPTEQVEVKEKVKEKEQDVCTHEFFTKETFIDWFNASRKYLKLQSNIKKLSSIERNLFDNLKDDYTIADFKKAFRNFSSDVYYSGNNLLFPVHFLKPENFVKYLNEKEKPKKQFEAPDLETFRNG